MFLRNYKDFLNIKTKNIKNKTSNFFNIREHTLVIATAKNIPNIFFATYTVGVYLFFDK